MSLRPGHLDRLPALATTSVGSLPHGDPAHAARHAVRAYDLPACPQLPRLDGDMLHEWLGADPGRCGWAPDRDREQPRAWGDWRALLAAAPPPHGVVKLQVTGPLTLAAGLERAAGRSGCARSTRELASELAAWLAAIVAPWVRALAADRLVATVVVDEPGLGMLGANPNDAQLWDPLRAVAPVWGLHLCGPVPWDVIEAARPQVLSFDVVRYPLTANADAAPVAAALLAGGTRLALGVLDATDPAHERKVATVTEATVAALVEAGGGEHAAVARRCWLTPTCGTGRLSIAREELVAARLTAVAAHLRGRWPHPNPSPTPMPDLHL